MTPVKHPDATRTPYYKSVQRLRGFIASFRAHVERFEAETGATCRIDETKLAQAFLDWLRAFDAQKPGDDDPREPFVGFAAGLMLAKLIAKAPVSVSVAASGGRAEDADDPLPIWPEGRLYVAYCLDVRTQVLEKDFDRRCRAAPAMDDPRVWTSFRENMREDPALAIGYLDLFAGDEPNWSGFYERWRFRADALLGEGRPTRKIGEPDG